jgi:hypothetical protein
MRGLQPERSEWRNCKAVVENVQGWAGEQLFTMKSEVVGRPSVVSDDLVQSVDQKICVRLRFTTSEFSCEFPHISLTLLYKIITIKLGSHVLRKMGFENAHRGT